ncbi:MAG: nucleotidyltransferase domain-containing protein [Elusimicrobia bacterium]|nr:nucleotidyltransferase domain-containing protein [Elusimicrobiota bacterium]
MSMLTFKTKLVKKLLTYSFTHPDENYYVRELALLINEDVGNLSRELRKLAEEGIYKSYIRGKLKIYSLNKKYSLYKEIKQIVFKTEGVEGSIKEIVSEFKNIELAFIFGSYAKDKERKTSDVDLILVGDLSKSDFTRKIRDLETKLNREINFNVYTKEEFNKEKSKKGGFLNLVLDDKIIVLKGILNDRY